MTNSYVRRATAAAALAAGLLVAFAALGGVSAGQSAISADQYQYGKKVTICHKGKNTISISRNAWPAHQRHGDVTGTCAAAKAKKAKAAKAKAAAKAQAAKAQAAAKAAAGKAKAEAAKAAAAEKKAEKKPEHAGNPGNPGNGNGQGRQGLDRSRRRRNDPREARLSPGLFASRTASGSAGRTRCRGPLP